MKKEILLFEAPIKYLINFILLVILISSIMSFYGGFLEAQNKVLNEFQNRIEECEENKTILRIYKNMENINVECFGELPETDLHIQWIY